MAAADITIKGKDESAAAVNRARENLKQLREEKKRLNDQVKITSSSFNQFGNLASTLGQTQLAGLIAQVENLTTSKLKLTEALKNSKLAMTGLGVAAVATGYSLGDSIRPYIPFFNEPDKLERSASILARIQAVSAQRTGLRDPAAGARATDRAKVEQEINSLHRYGPFGIGLKKTEQESELIFQLEQLQKEREVKLEEEKSKEISIILQSAANERLAMIDELAGAHAIERSRWLEEERSIFNSKLLNDEEMLKLAEDKYRIHQLKMSQIHQSRMDKELANEKAALAHKRQILQNQLELASQVFGSMAALSQAAGKKGFAAFQAFSIAQAIIDTYKAANASYAWAASWGGPAAGAIAAAAAIAAGIANVATIASQKPQAHGGTDMVGQDQTALLKRGEMVLDPGTSDEVRKAASNGFGAGGDVYLDGRKVGKVLWDMSRNGQLQIDGKAIT